MLEHVLRRFAQALLSLLLVSMLVFGMLHSVADPVAVLLPPTARESDREKLRAELGLDRPLPVQYAKFLSRAARGDFGRSFSDGRAVSKIIVERVPATLELAVLALLLSLAVGIPLGMYAGARPGTHLARAALWGSTLGISLPTFWIGLLLMMIFGVRLEWLPPQGRGPTREFLGLEWSFTTWSGFRHMILPAATLALHHVAMILRLMRSELLDVMKAPFIRVARAYGHSEGRVVGRFAMRNALVPVVTVTGLEFGQLVAFSVVTESIFQWPGLGRLLMKSIEEVDWPVVVAYVVLTCTMFIALNLIVDAVYALIDPRIRTGGGRGAA